MLELRNVSFEVDGKKILNNISLTMEDNRFTVITGPNGGGKSTLAKLIMGIEKPTEGEILFDGEDITAMSIDERAKRKIGYAFQQPPRFKGMSVRKLLSLAHGKDLDEEIFPYSMNPRRASICGALRSWWKPSRSCKGNPDSPLS